jgi:iron complex outermembrane receptor protein
VASYQFDPAHLVYASVSNGFRSGGVNKEIAASGLCSAELAAIGLTEAPKTYGSDRLRSYELGLKIQPSSIWRVAASVYYINWFDIIQPIDLTECGQTLTTNLGRAVSKGADLDATFVVSPRLQLNLLVNYDDAKFTQTIRNPSATSNIVTSGWTLGQTPWTVVGSSEYTFASPFGANSGYLRTDFDFHSKNSGLTSLTDPSSANYDPVLRAQPSTLDLRFRLGLRISAWDVSLFVNNATNYHPLLNRQDDSPGGAISYASAVRPITAGVTVQSRF